MGANSPWGETGRQLGLYLHSSGASTGCCPSLVVAGTKATLTTELRTSAIVLSIISVVPKSRPIGIAQGVTNIPIISLSTNTWKVLGD